MHVWTITGFVAVSIVAVATPGPDVILAIRNGSRVGMRRAIPGVLAVLCSDLLMILAVAAGLGAMLIASAFWFSVLKYLGAGYLLFLGLKMILARGTRAIALEVCTDSDFSEASALARRSFLVAVTNPKSYLFFAALLPQFIDPSSPPWPQYLALTGIFAVVELLIMMAYTLAGQRLGRFLSTKWTVWLERGGGAILVAAAASLLWIKRGPSHV